MMIQNIELENYLKQLSTEKVDDKIDRLISTFANHDNLSFENKLRINKTKEENPNAERAAILGKIEPNPYGIAYRSVSVDIKEQPKIKVTSSKVRAVAALIAKEMKTSVSFDHNQKGKIQVARSLSPVEQLESIIDQLVNLSVKKKEPKKLLQAALNKKLNDKFTPGLKVKNEKSLLGLDDNIKTYSRKLQLDNVLKLDQLNKLIHTEKGDLIMSLESNESGELIPKAMGINGKIRGEVFSPNSEIKLRNSSKTINIDSLAKKINLRPIKTREQTRRVKTKTPSNSVRLNKKTSIKNRI